MVDPTAWRYQGIPTVKYLVNGRNNSGRLVGLAPFDESDWPIAWRWMLASWHQVADDFTPPDLAIFLRLKEEQNAVHLGIYQEDELGGLFICEPRSPYL